MKRIKLKYVSLFFFWVPGLLFSNLLFAQNYIVSNWTVEDGLSSNDVKEILQDEAGFMWIATEHGLNKFDGYSFQNHRYHPSDRSTIGANYINSICKDEQENIWVNLAVGVVSKYDQRSKKFTNYYFSNRQIFINTIKFIPKIGICIATNQGLFTVDEQASEMTLLTPEEGEAPKNIYNFFPTSKQNIYLSTNKGFEFFDFATKRTSTTYFVAELDTIPFEYPVEKHFEDAQGVLWIQTTNGSLYRSEDRIHFKKSVEGKGRSFNQPKGHLFITEEDKNTKWFFTKDCSWLTNDESNAAWKPFPHSSDFFVFSFQDNAKNTWFWTKSQQLLKWDGQQLNFILDLSDRLTFNEIRQVYVDDKNGIWLASRGKGLWRVHNRTWPINSWKNAPSQAPITAEITALFSDNPDFMWLGAHDNLYQYYFATELIFPAFLALKNKNIFRNLRINAIAKDANGGLWIATSQGVIIVEKGGKNYWHIITDTNENYLGYTRCLIADPAGRMWIGTTRGLFLYDPNTEQIYPFFSDSRQNNSIKSNNIYCLSLLSETQFLIGYVKEGVDLVSFDPSNHSISCKKVRYENAKRPQYDLMTANTFYRSGEDYWVGTFSKGLLKLDLDQLTMHPLSKDFPIIPNIKRIQKGSKGNLWISSIDGIRSVNPEDKTFYRFSKASGLLSNQFTSNASVQDSSGNLYFGSLNGLNKIQPSYWNNQDTIATPILTDFKKYDQSIAFEQDLNEVESISLNHQDDYITFEFVAPTYDNPAEVQYAYQLDGFDDRWRYCHSQLSATYTNLAPGNYLFKIRAGNKGGFLNSKIKQIKIHVSPPFWQTSWFIFLCLGLLIGLIWVAFKIQSTIRSNRLKIVAEIRKKAADDFHDELGHRLTKIVLFVESLMRQKSKFPQASVPLLRKIQDNANGLFYSTKDFIWAMNPSKDSALDLFIVLRDFGDELFADTSIQFSMEGLQEDYKNHILDMDSKRQIVMIFKEAMNNVLKHSKGNIVVLNVQKEGQQLKLTLTDDGQGFILDHQKFGYGLGSMFNRSKKIKAPFVIHTAPEKGTEISLKI